MNIMQLPIGYDDFGKVIEKGLNYVDKSLFIKEVLDDINTEAIVITRPRRFGKTFNLSMLHYFLAAKVYGKSTENLFNQLEIAKCSEEYMQHQGKYPVISITFKDIKSSNFHDAYSKLHELIVGIYDAHSYLDESDKLSKNQRRLYGILIDGKANRNQLENSLKTLMEGLYAYHGVKQWLLIDEYDTPIQSAYVNLNSAVKI